MGLEKTKSVVRIFKSVSDGAHANTRGFHGSLTAYSLQKIFNEVDPYGKNFLDIGFGTGVVLAAALTSGAAKAHGYELPENQANQDIFQAAMRRISSKLCHISDISRRVMLDFNDIVKVFLRNRWILEWFMAVCEWFMTIREWFINYITELDHSFLEIKA